MSYFIKRTDTPRNNELHRKPLVGLFTHSEKVREYAKQAIVLLGGTLRHDITDIETLTQASSAIDIGIIEPTFLQNPARDAPFLLDDPTMRIVLFGGEPGLAVTRPAVRAGVDCSRKANELFLVLKKVLESSALPEAAPKLSLRERETLQLYGRGYTLKAIAQHLDISAKSVDTYKVRACRKLGLKDRASVLEFTEPSLRRIHAVSLMRDRSPSAIGKAAYR